MKSIVVIFPHFGKLPPQYKMWRASALYNADIDFLFFTDCDVEPAKNIFVHKEIIKFYTIFFTLYF